VEIFKYTSSKLLYPTNTFRSGNVSVGQQSRGYQYIGLVVGSLALANAETNVLQISEWEIYGTSYGCAQVSLLVDSTFCMHVLSFFARTSLYKCRVSHVMDILCICMALT
jgi:hypothetical protein